jgi:hypothetical protein
VGVFGWSSVRDGSVVGGDRDGDRRKRGATKSQKGKSDRGSMRTLEAGSAPGTYTRRSYIIDAIALVKTTSSWAGSSRSWSFSCR